LHNADRLQKQKKFVPCQDQRKEKPKQLKGVIPKEGKVRISLMHGERIIER